MNRSLAAAAVFVGSVCTAAALAQSKTPLQRFPLNTPIPESAITACKSADVPIQLNTLMAQGKEDEASIAFEHAVVEGNCINGRGMVTYLRQVHRVDSPGGGVLTVYEARAGGIKFYVPMLGYLHEELSA